jgi:diaminopimelate epimerase
MLIPFEKYQGTGNDFVIIDNRDQQFKPDTNTVRLLCDRKFGIGADGLMLLENIKGYDFKMVYFNADGNESSMCGNGGRCLSAFAFSRGMFDEKCKFIAIDGEHEAVVQNTDDEKVYWVSLKMMDVNEVKIQNDHLEIDTGSPHYLKFVDSVKSVDVFSEGKSIRNSAPFVEKGINVNFLEMEDGVLKVRTYERGVEDETLSCGTGVTASALAASVKGLLGENNICKLETEGGNLQVRFRKKADNQFDDIWLEGAATFVFKGEIEA